VWIEPSQCDLQAILSHHQTLTVERSGSDFRAWVDQHHLPVERVLDDYFITQKYLHKVFMMLNPVH